MNSFKTPFQPPVAELLTPRLRIRIDSEESYIAMFHTTPDAELQAWCGFATAGELAVQRVKVEGGLSNYRSSTVFFHLIETTTQEVIGNIAFHNWYQIHRRSELGYAMNADRWKGQGFMKEALPAVLRFGFEEMDLNRIEAFISPENTASRRLVEANHFRLEGELRQHYVHGGRADNSLVYGLLREEQ